MTTSRLLVDNESVQRIAEQTTAARRRLRPARPRTGHYVPEHAPTLIDGLIDRVHSDWPETTFILSLPSGERILVPRHVDGPRCGAEHSGSFQRCVLPFCEMEPSHCCGRCRMTPVAPDDHPAAPAPFYEVDLRSGMLVMGAGPATGSSTRGSRHAAHHR